MSNDPHKDFAIRLGAMHAEAGQLGLYEVMHKIHAAVQAVGWEIERIQRGKVSS